MKILVTGADGQLGSELKELAPAYSRYRFLFTDINELDLTDEPTVQAFIAADKPDVIINCAAFTAVDKAETEPEAAYRVNVLAPRYLARAAKRHYSFLVHISTDYVYDGTGNIPVTEDIPVNPVSVYGKTKLEGETEVRKNAGRAVIFRTSWLYSPFGNNFLKTILNKGRERGSLNVVYDQTGTPTYARDLVQAILESLQEAMAVDGIQLYNYSNEGVTSWYDFAVEIIREAGIPCEIHPIETSQYPLPAPRPVYSVLNKKKFRDKFHISIPYWRNSMMDCLKRMKPGT